MQLLANLSHLPMQEYWVKCEIAGFQNGPNGRSVTGPAGLANNFGRELLNKTLRMVVWNVRAKMIWSKWRNATLELRARRRSIVNGVLSSPWKNARESVERVNKRLLVKLSEKHKMEESNAEARNSFSESANWKIASIVVPTWPIGRRHKRNGVAKTRKLAVLPRRSTVNGANGSLENVRLLVEEDPFHRHEKWSDRLRTAVEYVKAKHLACNHAVWCLAQ